MENYFNYFTEIEERFQQCRGTRRLLSPLDWALIEAWKEAGLPLEAVLVGVERSFEKFRRKPRPWQRVNSLAYCSQEILRAVEEAKAAEVQGGARRGSEAPAASPFSPTDLLDYLRHNADLLHKAAGKAREEGQPVLADDLAAAAAALREIAARDTGKLMGDLSELENCLSAQEEKLTASLTRAASTELLAQLRSEVGRGLGPYRRKMSGAQIESLERQFLKQRLFEHRQIPRLSLFYL